MTEELDLREQKKVYLVEGQLFFASVSEFPAKFTFADSVQEVEIDLTHAHLWDDSAIGALDKIEMKFDENNIKVTYLGLNDESHHLKNA